MAVPAELNSVLVEEGRAQLPKAALEHSSVSPLQHRCVTPLGYELHPPLRRHSFLHKMLTEYERTENLLIFNPPIPQTFAKSRPAFVRKIKNYASDG